MATAKTTSTTTVKGLEPKFETLVTDMSAADAEARSTSADATQARGKRSTVAVQTILAAHAEKIEAGAARKQLIEAGVLKGTASKIATILTALSNKTIKPSDVKSLNGAYSTVKAAEEAGRAAALGVSATAASTPAPAPAVVATTPEAAMQVILDSIRKAGDPDAVFKSAGEWITKITNEISDLTRTFGAGEED